MKRFRSARFQSVRAERLCKVYVAVVLSRQAVGVGPKRFAIKPLQPIVSHINYFFSTTHTLR